MINIKNFDSTLYYFIISEVDVYIKEKNWNKYLTFYFCKSKQKSITKIYRSLQCNQKPDWQNR